MNKFEEELSSLPVSKSTNYTEYWNKAQLLTVFKDWQPQQALPAVHEWLDIEIKYFKSTSKHPTVDVVFGVADAIVAVKNGNTHSKLYDYLFCGKQDVCNQHQAIFARAWLDGYTVEKPQLFYLKNKLTGFYLFKAFGGKYGEEFYRSTINLTDDFKFTQQEISNMETGSYEQIEVVQ